MIFLKAIKDLSNKISVHKNVYHHYCLWPSTTPHSVALDSLDSVKQIKNEIKMNLK